MTRVLPVLLLSLATAVAGQQTTPNASALDGRLHTFSFATSDKTPMPATTATTAVYWIVNGVDYAGNDVGNKPSKTAEGCYDACSTFSACTAFTWTSHNGGTCWLKSAKGTVLTAPDARSAVVRTSVAPSGVCFAVEDDVDYSGKLLGKAFTDTAEGCCAECEKRASDGCGAYTWTIVNGFGTCWLQDAAGTRKFATGARSAVVRSTKQCVLAGNADFVGNDVANQPGKTPSECCDSCANVSGCNAFTWTDYNGGTCWLKSAAGARTTTAGAVSGSRVVV